MLDVGEGLMVLLIFPDNTTMLFDCNVTNDNKEKVLHFLAEWIPKRHDSESKTESQWIDVFVNSHRDTDHFRGLKQVNEQFAIHSIWDSGQYKAGATGSTEYNYYMDLRRKIKAKYGENALVVPTPSNQPIRTLDNAEIYCLSSIEDAVIEFSSSLKGLKEHHTNCIVLSIRYAGRSILLTGDSDWYAWKNHIVPDFEDTALLQNDILQASHHGSRSFFTDEEENDTIDEEKNPDTTYTASIQIINPSITLIPCGSYETYHHPNKDALKLYEQFTKRDDRDDITQVYTTFDKGHFCGFIDNQGQWTVVPHRFRPYSPDEKHSFQIRCQMIDKNGTRTNKDSGDLFFTGTQVEFWIDAIKKIVAVSWEVSNGGANDHAHYQNIYDNSPDEKNQLKFKRDVSFEGLHLLRCEVLFDDNVRAVQIFAVRATHPYSTKR